MDAHWTYFLILSGSIAGPLLLSFDRKVAYFRRWPDVFLAMLLPAMVFILWDIRFAQAGVWSFSPGHTVGLRWWGLPVEEILFFFVVPFCCVFIHVCVRAYLPHLSFDRTGRMVLRLIAALVLTVGLFFMDRDYTSWTAVLLAIYIGLVLTRQKWFAGFRSDFFLVSFSISLVPFLVVNGILTSIPVVSYNDSENLGVRLGTIPMEDVFYGMLLMLMNISILERKQHPAVG